MALCLHPRIPFQQLYNPSCVGPSWLIHPHQRETGLNHGPWSISPEYPQGVPFVYLHWSGCDLVNWPRSCPLCWPPFISICSICHTPLFLLPGIPTPSSNSRSPHVASTELLNAFPHFHAGKVPIVQMGQLRLSNLPEPEFRLSPRSPHKSHADSAEHGVGTRGSRRGSTEQQRQVGPWLTPALGRCAFPGLLQGPEGVFVLPQSLEDGRT